MKDEIVEAIMEALEGLTSPDLLERACAYIVHLADIENKRLH